MKELYNRILHTQSRVPRQFARSRKTPFGELFCNPHNTLSEDANHGVVYTPLSDYASAFCQTKEFYSQQNIRPRLWFYVPKEEVPAIERAARQMGGSFAVSDLQLLIKFPERQPMPATKLAFTVEHAFDPALRETVVEEELQLEGVITASLQNQGVSHIVGRLFGTPVTMALFYENDTLIRLSNIKTGSGFRGCGFGGALLPFALNLAAEKDKPAYLFANNPVAIRLYQRAGMEIHNPGFVLCKWNDEVEKGL